MKTARNLIFLFILGFVVPMMLFGCGNKDNMTYSASDNTQDEEQTAAYDRIQDKVGRIYLITNVDTEQEQIMLRDIENARQLLYKYDLTTMFKDKYGGNLSITDFHPGRACVIEGLDSTGLITELKHAGETWEMDGVENYSMDLERGIFTIGVTNYYLPSTTPVFSNELQLDLFSISENDILRVTGREKDILALTVTTGHGSLHLINTSVFDGSLICIGDIYTLVNGETEIEVPEGTYNVTVANKGYGGTAEVTVDRNAIVVLDLDSIKGELQYCKLKFTIEVKGAKIYLDGDKIKKNKEIDVPYGKHSLMVSAEGYESWTKDLYVNSPTATIMLTMDEEGTTNNNSNSNTNNNTNSNTNNNTNNNNTNNNTNNNSNNNNNNNTNNDSNNQTEEEKRQQTELDYLTTIRDTVSSIMNSVSM